MVLLFTLIHCNAVINTGRTTRCGQTTLRPEKIQGADMEIRDSFKNLGLHLNNKVDWSQITDALYREDQTC